VKSWTIRETVEEIPPVVASETTCPELGHVAYLFCALRNIQENPYKKTDALHLDLFMEVYQTYANRITDQAGYISDI
jgi:hypothetical protein